MRRVLEAAPVLAILAAALAGPVACRAPTAPSQRLPDCVWDLEFGCDSGGGSWGWPVGDPSTYVTVHTATTGPVTDSAGYPALARWYDVTPDSTITGERRYGLPLEGQMTVTVPAASDSLTLALDSLPAGCSADDNPREMSLRSPPDSGWTTSFLVTCSAP
ncbi:MAG TPA: hypothetical protein VKA44_07035 [Gemmatimonadota bacterium]|nr:hypothetical protein [Gemmatimonadota bacterium]